MTSYLWGTPVDVEIRLENEDARRKSEVKLEKDRRESLPVYLDGESVIGQVRAPTKQVMIGRSSSNWVSTQQGDSSIARRAQACPRWNQNRIYW